MPKESENIAINLDEILRLTVDVTVSYLKNNSLPASEVPSFMNLIHSSLSKLRSNEKITETSNISTKNISGIQVTSPIIGTAYHAPEPGAKKFVEVGKKIKKGETVMIVEAMKTMNHVPSTSDGIVKEICVEDGQPVEFGQTIIILE